MCTAVAEHVNASSAAHGPADCGDTSIIGLMFAMPQVRGRLKQMQVDFESATSAADAVAAASEAAFAAKESEAQVRPWPLYFLSSYGVTPCSGARLAAGRAAAAAAQLYRAAVQRV